LKLIMGLAEGRRRKEKPAVSERNLVTLQCIDLVSCGLASQQIRQSSPPLSTWDSLSLVQMSP